MSPFSEVPTAEYLAANDFAFAIRDRHPVSLGHSLIVARREIASWWDASAEEQAAIGDLVGEVTAILELFHAPDGYNVGFNAGEAAGQTVPHLHVHVIPRYRGDAPAPRGGMRNVIPHRETVIAPSLLSPESVPLVTPAAGRLHLELVRCLINPFLDRIDLLVSFVMRSGTDLLASRLDDALARGAHVRLLTTDYLEVTDVGALGFFLDRIGEHPGGGRLETRVFCDPATSFHPKAYLFSSSTGQPGTAFVGSSNLSHSGLRRGVEWNILSRDVAGLIAEFNSLWVDPRSIPLTKEWLELYRARRELAAGQRIEHRDTLVADEEPEAPITPWSVQREALAALVATRVEGHQTGLVVMATGLGKTWLAAFDSTRPEVRRVLFVAHREEILTQARDVYRRIRPGGSLTLFTGTERDLTGDVVFASVQSLQRNLALLDGDEFDYVVVDEFHHAAAPSYRSVLGHLRPRFLLGLTATPDRADAADLLALCCDNLVYDCGLVEGVQRSLLSPFRYRAIRDVADYAEIPWRNGRFDPAGLTNRLETQQRAEQIYEEWTNLRGADRRALGFCCSIPHANFMASYFAERGAAVAAVHSGPASANRAESLVRLDAGDLDVVFTVDIFNEGVDVPSLDLVMMLRPTESPVVFFQQLGRGLRKADGKDSLDVIDFVGNHRSFVLKARLLATLAGRSHFSDRESVELLREPLEDLPEGCSIKVDLDAVDLLVSMLGAPKSHDLLAELTREWIESHDGRRPTALELSLVTNKAHELTRVGGWFGFLDGIGLLSPEEQAVLRLASSFLLDIERGSYTKSYKLITLSAMIDARTLRGKSSLRDIALAARWRIFRDPRLLVDLDDATGSFADVRQPTETEWQSYWRKNPINALTGGNTRATEPRFVLEGDALRLSFEVSDDLGAAFDDMVAEIVDYRLHRYLVARAATRVGERRKPVSTDGRTLDATFVVDSVLGTPVSVLFESAGGAGPNGGPRNPDYVACVDLVMTRLRDLGATILDAYVDSGRIRELPISDRRLDPGTGRHFPIELAGVEDPTALRRSLLSSMVLIGRAPGAKGGGNPRKAMRLLIAGVDEVGSAADLARALEHGVAGPRDDLRQATPAT